MHVVFEKLESKADVALTGDLQEQLRRLQESLDEKLKEQDSKRLEEQQRVEAMLTQTAQDVDSRLASLEELLHKLQEDVTQTQEEAKKTAVEKEEAAEAAETSREDRNQLLFSGVNESVASQGSKIEALQKEVSFLRMGVERDLGKAARDFIGLRSDFDKLSLICAGASLASSLPAAPSGSWGGRGVEDVELEERSKTPLRYGPTLRHSGPSFTSPLAAKPSPAPMGPGSAQLVKGPAMRPEPVVDARRRPQQVLAQARARQTGERISASPPRGMPPLEVPLSLPGDELDQARSQRIHTLARVADSERAEANPFIPRLVISNERSISPTGPGRSDPIPAAIQLRPSPRGVG
eukprot:TRINITY_DN21690_c0_g1_i3.p1 TRINITY_DN21690_c0_g1~~TRINITY_DN21690_c0_g1_i3.p1  ORF type:complete len:351 (+),score=80.59 TRINITY_DN21690_c0_g1_i3:189-1241(+)